MKSKIVLFVAFSVFLAANATISPLSNLTPNNRTKCPEDNNRPPNRVNTTVVLKVLRDEMKKEGLSVYIITNSDENLNSGAHNMRVKRISGFSGSSGFAIVTDDKAVLSTDSRYFEQADDEMDCNWILLKSGVPGYPTPYSWILSETNIADSVGLLDASTTHSSFQAYTDNLQDRDVRKVTDDLVARNWTQRPPLPDNDIFIHTYEYTGQNHTDKISRIRNSINAGDVRIITDLPEIAWSFNIRGDDLNGLLTSPLFYSFALIPKDPAKNPTLYLKNFAAKLGKNNLKEHLKCDNQGQCPPNQQDCIKVKEYATFFTDLPNTPDRHILPSNVNLRVHDAATTPVKRNSAIQMMKAVKNDVEYRRYFECQVRDSAHLVEFMAFFEDQIVNKKADNWTELTAANYLDSIRRRDPVNRGISFGTISSIGPNAAINHYRPTKLTDRRITRNELYLLDSGGQYLDGTTDVTRTFHFGTPTADEKLAYTTVLKSVIGLASLVWPEGIKTNLVDMAARAPTWKTGWGYGHGTGHGISYFLTVHEGPSNLNYQSARDIVPNMLFSDEPGFYKSGKYGVRLESIVGVTKWKGAETYLGRTYLTFEAATLVPFEPKLINYDDLTKDERVWLNNYNEECKKKTGEYLKSKGKTEAVKWLEARTKKLSTTPNWDQTTQRPPSGGSALRQTSVFGLISLFLLYVLS
ncbi:DgyrCDS6362 [Dimorphilus gyrociliatus]|uniref:DgyrCDS6362 n=1 Tax=Dimorphilus gyrociliatus TaxID=2664684 RepID=A0A7I8VPG1_9ANNE|nr:DgyrCDS6362 [Dimorphilus gyrociliatus]